MINGAHMVVFSSDSEADRSFFRDVLDLPAVDAGGGWLIFGLPPSEVAFHPAEGKARHELYLMTDSIKSFVEGMSEHGISCDAIDDQGWGLITRVKLPGGSWLGVYEPRHARPPVTP